MIEKMYGAEIFYDDAANAIIPKAYADAYDECELEIAFPAEDRHRADREGQALHLHSRSCSEAGSDTWRV